MLFSKKHNFFIKFSSILKNILFFTILIINIKPDYTSAEIFSINEEIYQKKFIKNTIFILLELNDQAQQYTLNKNFFESTKSKIDYLYKIERYKYFPDKNNKHTKKIYKLWLTEYKENIDFFNTLIIKCKLYSANIMNILNIYIIKNINKPMNEKIKNLIKLISSIPNYIFYDIALLFQSEFDKKIIFPNEDMEEFKEKLKNFQKLTIKEYLKNI